MKDLKAALAEATEAHDNAVKALEEERARPAPRCTATLFGIIPVPCRVVP